MRTIIKTGAVLHLPEGTFDPYGSDLPLYARDARGLCVVHGDLHVIDRAFILYMAHKQAPVWLNVHGRLNLGYKFFFRKSHDSFHTLVVPFPAVALWQDDIHESYWPELEALHVTWINEKTHFPVPDKPTVYVSK